MNKEYDTTTSITATTTSNLNTNNVRISCMSEDLFRCLHRFSTFLLLCEGLYAPINLICSALYWPPLLLVNIPLSQLSTDVTGSSSNEHFTCPNHWPFFSSYPNICESFLLPNIFISNFICNGVPTLSQLVHIY